MIVSAVLISHGCCQDICSSEQRCEDPQRSSSSDSDTVYGEKATRAVSDCPMQISGFAPAVDERTDTIGTLSIGDILA